MGKRMKMAIVLLAALMVIPCGLFAAGSYEGLTARVGIGHLTDSDIGDYAKMPLDIFVDYDIPLPTVHEVTIRPNIGLIYIKGKDEADGMTIKEIPVMVDAVYHISQPGMQVRPYFGAGLGFIHGTLSGTEDNDGSETRFAFGFLGGVEFPLSPTGSFVAQLDYILCHSDKLDVDMDMFNLSVGYKFRF